MKIRLIAGAAFAVLAATPVLAQPPAGGAGAPAVPGGPGGMMRGPQTRAEVQQMVQDRFARADANHDGFVTREELDAAMAAEGRGAGGRGPGRGGRGNMFDRADANHDGKLTADELAAPFLARFDRVDANHDGTISPEEREAAMAAMRARWQERRGGGDEAGPPPQDGGQPQD